jgi:UTP-glucose-1-phosphate uridylyltransferase
MTQRIRKAVFPVAGLGTRFLPATKSIGAVAICVGIDFGVISSKRRLSDHAARSIA